MSTTEQATDHDYAPRLALQARAYVRTNYAAMQNAYPPSQTEARKQALHDRAMRIQIARERRAERRIQMVAALLFGVPLAVALCAALWRLALWAVLGGTP